MLSREVSRRGDTLIEVLLAISVFSLLAVVSMTIMNQSTNAAQRAVEVTLVRQQIDMQVEALRAAHQAHAALGDELSIENSQWSQIKSAVANNGAPGSDTVDVNQVCNANLAPTDNPFASNGKNVFILNPYTADLGTDTTIPMSSADAPLFSQTKVTGSDVKSYGLWIEGERESAVSPLNIPAAYNFRVRACWFAAGTTQPMELETLIRLYDVDYS